VQYDICLTDEVVRRAEDEGRAAGRAKIVRQSVRMSSLGRVLWYACHPHAESPIHTVSPASDHGEFDFSTHPIDGNLPEGTVTDGPMSTPPAIPRRP
jgi:hypothetical protein